VPSPFSALRRIVPALTLVAVAAACGSGGSTPPTTPPSTSSSPSPSTSPGFLTYANGAAGFTIEYPSTWEKSEDVQGTTIVLFRSPSEGESDPVRETVAVDTEALPPGFTLQQFIDNGLSQVQEVHEGFILISSESATLAGFPAHRIVYTGQQDDTELKWLQEFTVVNGTVYVLTFVASPDSYDTFEPTALDMFASFFID
jgi:hypothetical protein